VRTQLIGALDDVEEERAKALAEVANEKDDLHREIAAIQKHKVAQQGRVVLDVGGYRYTTSIQTLRRLPGTFFDAYFSGRYAMEQGEDGSIFLDRDGEHFGKVLEDLRDSVVAVAKRDASDLNVGELHWLKREFAFYCIELYAKPQEVAFASGGMFTGDGQASAGVERYNTDGTWREVAAMSTAQHSFGLSEFDGELYVTGGSTGLEEIPASVERYDSRLDTWSAAAALPHPRQAHCCCAVGDAMYVMGGGVSFEDEDEERVVSSVLKFSCRTQSWSEAAPMPMERDDAGATVLGNNIYVLGVSGSDGQATSTSFRFSTETNEWATLAPMPEAKCCHCVCVLASNIYVMGVEVLGGTSNSVHRFDPVANSWSLVPPMSVERSSFGAFVLGGSIYAVGASDLHGARVGETQSMERYCVASNSWSVVDSAGFDEASSIHTLQACAMKVEVDLFDSLIAKAALVVNLGKSPNL
jgi:hypothetical protein